MLTRQLGALAVGEAVAEGAEPPVEGNDAVAVVALKIAVVEIVKIRARGPFAVGDRSLEAVVRTRRPERRVLHREDEVERVRRHHQVDQTHAKVESRLDGVHRHARPGDRVDVLVVQVVDAVVDRLPVDEPVHPVEMKFPPERDDEQPRHEPHGMPRPVEVRDVVVRIQPERQHLVARPHEQRDAGGPEDVVVNLVAKEELPAVLRGPAGVVFALRALAPKRVEIEMIGAVIEPHQDEIAQVDLADPAGLEVDAAGEGGLREVPGTARDGEQQEVTRPHEARVRDHPLQHRAQPERPLEDRSIADGVGRTPLTAGVARLGRRRFRGGQGVYRHGDDVGKAAGSDKAANAPRL